MESVDWEHAVDVLLTSELSYPPCVGAIIARLMEYHPERFLQVSLSELNLLSVFTCTPAAVARAMSSLLSGFVTGVNTDLECNRNKYFRL